MLVILGIVVLAYFVLNIGERVIRWRYGVDEGVIFAGINVEGMLEDEVRDVVSRLDEKIMSHPTNARLKQGTGDIILDLSGVKINIATTVKKIMKAENNARVEPDLIALEPEITYDLLANINKEIGYYYTWAGNGGNRLTNIQVAAAYINNYLMPPGAVFSFNDVTGPHTYERGYRLAPIIVGGSIVPGLGGGVCQVSSTLYNAVLEAGLEVIERYPHSRPVGYVPLGRDATVSNVLDFKFRNSTDRFLIIKMSAWGCVEACILQN